MSAAMDEEQQAASSGGGGASSGGAASGGRAWFTGKGELELEVPFVEKYRPVLVSPCALEGAPPCWVASGERGSPRERAHA